MVNELEKVIEVMGTFALGCETGKYSDFRLGRDLLFLLQEVYLQVYPQVFVIHAVNVQEFGRLNIRFFIHESHHIPAQLPQKLLESSLLQVFLIELSRISQEYVQCYLDMPLGKALCKHVVHVEVDLIHGIKVFNILCISLSLCQLREISKPSASHILVLQDVI